MGFLPNTVDIKFLLSRIHFKSFCIGTYCIVIGLASCSTWPIILLRCGKYPNIISKLSIWNFTVFKCFKQIFNFFVIFTKSPFTQKLGSSFLQTTHNVKKQIWRFSNYHIYCWLHNTTGSFHSSDTNCHHFSNFFFAEIIPEIIIPYSIWIIIIGIIFIVWYSITIIIIIIIKILLITVNWYMIFLNVSY